MKKENATSKKIINKKPINVLIKRKFVGKQSLTDALVPIICDDMRSKVENRTLDNDSETQ